MIGIRCLPAVLALALAACAKESAEDRAVARLQDELGKVQADNDRMAERLSTLEIQAAQAADQGPAQKKAPSTPTLRVVQLGVPADERAERSDQPPPAGDDTEDVNPRPTIRVQGVRGAKGAAGKPLIEETIPDEGVGDAPKTQPSALDANARRAYDAAMAEVQAKEYDKALESFAGFLVRWPDHPYADNATYWRGECYFAKGEYARALEQFEALLVRFPLGNKVPDALLKAGISQQKLGNPLKAGTYFDRLRREYPKSDAARRIPQVNP